MSDTPREPDASLTKMCVPEAGLATGKGRPQFVVGIGASAGGLEALEKFFDHVPTDTAIAYVVVQHLSPDFRSLMDELLARHTRIPIFRVEDGMVVEPNAIYLIPPKKEMIIAEGKLLLTDKDPSQSLALPIDIFLRSLAQDFGPRSVGIILSGTGSDGSRGIRAIHEAGGLVIAQDEETAKFDGMPRSAFDTGVVDFVLPPEQIPDTLLKWIILPSGAPASDVERGGISTDAMETVFRLLRAEYGIDFSHYKPNTVMRRIERRLLLCGCSELGQYVVTLAQDPQELNALYRDLLIGVTKFFRDHEAFERLESEIVRVLVSKTRPDDEVRVWAVGCATGEETYSLAMLFLDAMSALGRTVNTRIFATDVHRASLDFASAGVYPETSVTDIPPNRLQKYFVRHGSSYHVSADLRRMIVFAPHNILKDAPFTKLDLIVCRNLLIYLQPLAQKKALSLFHFALRTGGIMFLGPSESPGEIADEFDTLNEHWKLYRKRRDVRLPTDLRLPVSAAYSQLRPGGPPPTLPVGMPDVRLLRAYDALLDEYVPPSLLVSERSELLHTFSGAGRWLVSPDGRPSLDVLDLVPRDLKPVLGAALQRAVKDNAPVVYTGIEVRGPDGEQQIRLTVKPLPTRDQNQMYTLVSLEPMISPPAPPVAEGETVDLNRVSRDQLNSMELELRYTKENLQATIEELETSNEELQATNEELVASNEELQSTNEELHSVNEELYTVNAEYQRKIAELTQLTDDMDNLLASTDVGTVFLDRNLCIRKFNPQIAEAFHILPQDVGRRIDSFSYNIDYPGLLDDLTHVLESGTRFEKEVRDRHGHCLLLRILPYRSKSGVDGVVLTLVDVSLLKQAEKQLRLMSKVFMDGADPIVIEDLHGRVIDLNSEAERVYGWGRSEILGQSVEQLMPEAQRGYSAEIRERCRRQEHLRNLQVTRCDKWGNLHPVLLTLSLLTDESGQPVGIATIAKDIAAIKRAEEERQHYAAELEASNRVLRENIASRQKAEQQAREAVRRRDQFLAILSHELRNPLGAILNATYLLDRPQADDGLREEARAVIRRQAQQMARLLDDLLDVSRITQNKIEIRKQVVDLRHTAAEAVEVVRPLVESRNQRLSVSLPDAPLLVNGDPSRLQQIQVNLLNNATKYTPAGGEIWLRMTLDGGQALLSVRDTGEGIPPNMLESIFDLFIQCGDKLDRSEGGMGVGLTLVRMLVEMHGGHVTAHSPGPGKGSEFVVSLPASTQQPPEVPVPMNLAASGRTAKVLIVEDNDDSREMLSTLLELEGYVVSAAKDGLQGLEAIRNERPDVALLDIGLPELDGYHLARQIRADRSMNCVYLVALTGYGRNSDRVAVLEAGFNEHLVKPVRPEDLARVLKAGRAYGAAGQ